jgi:predicted dehydrogenase
MNVKIKVGIIGFGNRGYSFALPLCGMRFKNKAELVGIYDSQPKKVQFAKEWLENRSPQTLVVNNFSEFLKLEMDVVMICTPQSEHVKDACATLKAGKNVFLEKPMARNVEECDLILNAAKTSEKELLMGFNLRHHSVCVKIKEMISQGMVGKPQNIICTDFYSNGYSYFRRWHRMHANSGGLMVEKGCHSLDLINWYMDSEPVKVAAFGGLNKFKPLPEAGMHCSNCSKTDTCEYYIDKEALALESTKNTGLNPQWVLGEPNADLCVFNSEKDTFDNHTAIIEYANGCRGTYIESFTSSVKTKSGRQFVINGTKGQIWASLVERKIEYFPEKVCREIKQSPSVVYNIPEEVGSHGGADDQMLNYIFGYLTGKHLNDKMCPRAGRNAVLVAAAAEKSVTENQIINLVNTKKCKAEGDGYKK